MTLLVLNFDRNVTGRKINIRAVLKGLRGGGW